MYLQNDINVFKQKLDMI